MDDPIWILQKTQHLRVTVNSFVHFIDSINSVKLFNRTKTQCIAECSEILYLLSLISLPLAQPDCTPAFIDGSSPMRLTTRPSLGITAVSAVEFSVEVAINPTPSDPVAPTHTLQNELCHSGDSWSETKTAPRHPLIS